MDRLWSPWRYDYIKSGSSDEQTDPPPCVFCAMLGSAGDDESKFILHRAAHNFIVLNIYPYISGHLMIVPYAHLAEIASAPKEVTDEMMDLTKRSQTILREVYHPHGFNLGMNLGRAAGAGVAVHFHMHIMQSCKVDTNFMSSIGQMLIIPDFITPNIRK